MHRYENIFEKQLRQSLCLVIWQSSTHDHFDCPRPIWLNSIPTVDSITGVRTSIEHDSVGSACQEVVKCLTKHPYVVCLEQLTGAHPRLCDKLGKGEFFRIQLAKLG